MEGRKMKKLFGLLVAALFVGVLNVDAMTETELRKRFDETITINGTKYAVSAGDKKAADDYLAANELSDADCDYISKKIDEGIALVKNEKTGVAKDFSAETKTKLKKLVSDIAANTSVKATVKENALVILNADGSTFYEVTALVKQTGTETNNIAIIAGAAFVITVAGAFLVVRQLKNN